MVDCDGQMDRLRFQSLTGNKDILFLDKSLNLNVCNIIMLNV